LRSAIPRNFMGLTSPIQIASRGSALALVQANMVQRQCRESFPNIEFDLKIIKTTGDKLQTATLKQGSQESTKGLFTRELEVALLDRHADLAVHSLKDLPTELPPGLILGAVSQRADVRDVLIYRDQSQSHLRGLAAGSGLRDFPRAATIGTTSTRRQAQLLAIRSDLQMAALRGNVGTRLQKLAAQPELDGIVLAAAGLERLGFSIESSGRLVGKGTPAGLFAMFLSTDEMVPCVGQAALGIEIREKDPEIAAIVAKLNDPVTFACVTAERAFLHAMGGGCLSPVGALARADQAVLRMRAVSFNGRTAATAEADGPMSAPEQLGHELARRLTRS
jgi:hydroxymethylbilane synthase